MSHGTHQIDLFNWFLGVRPKTVMASGGTDYYDGKTHEWPDAMMVVYTYETSKGTVRAFYQTVNTNGNLGHYEKFLGDEGALVISEDKGLANVYREGSSPDWDRWVNLDYLTRPGPKEGGKEGGALIAVTETAPPPHYGVPVAFDEPFHKPHLQNFFDAVRGRVKLNCPPEAAYQTAVTVSKAMEALNANRTMEFTADDFKV